MTDGCRWPDPRCPGVRTPKSRSPPNPGTTDNQAFANTFAHSFPLLFWLPAAVHMPFYIIARSGGGALSRQTSIPLPRPIIMPRHGCRSSSTKTAGRRYAVGQRVIGDDVRLAISEGRTRNPEIQIPHVLRARYILHLVRRLGYALAHMCMSHVVLACKSCTISAVSRDSLYIPSGVAAVCGGMLLSHPRPSPAPPNPLTSQDPWTAVPRRSPTDRCPAKGLPKPDIKFPSIFVDIACVCGVELPTA
ncbi:hypothetical protein B0T25DRAFT_243370 [Lasiosphaeria hispida]|uniref:Uncharacterized protein n=1 Tax=Lasiosphaeria hispida TaxID=260671 RepID=A0AAJ0HF78_9PEZI|nr:hypothetical protein B0T25DRAFT_243370 [Lasiosphaeria hispida]